ncbi:hypothetical protein EYF80_003736 [Liparis tanakae]|uniref:Uncharacterized protein n=1 Tax=Liparis tanakae TaxID=230148 RepID=A0A4Z2J8U9_9TELE|nr:hypothetical protein EYF80_003736 [Liparis tanakae]
MLVCNLGPPAEGSQDEYRDEEVIGHTESVAAAACSGAPGCTPVTPLKRLSQLYASTPSPPLHSWRQQLHRRSHLPPTIINLESGQPEGSETGFASGSRFRGEGAPFVTHLSPSK